jgi:hypothetical protein
VPLTTKSILLQSMQTTTLSDMHMLASTHTQMALTLFLMTSRMRIQQQPRQMTTKSQMIIPTVKQGRNIMQISSQKNFQHSQHTSSRTKMNLFLLWDHKPNTLLALSIGTLTFHMPIDSCPDWYNSQMVHHFCQPCKPSQLRMLPTANFLRRNSWSKRSLRGICKIPRSDNKTLSCQQWMLCGQCLHAIGSQIWSNNILLWSQFKLSKWNHQEAHPRPLWASLQTTLTCKGKMARGDWD